MSVSYRTDTLATPPEPKTPLNKYHTDISDIISEDLLGLTGQNNQIGKIIVSQELSDSDVQDLQDWLGAPISKVQR